ncbi:MAG: potassium transporter Kup [Gemmatimonadota bacterium]
MSDTRSTGGGAGDLSEPGSGEAARAAPHGGSGGGHGDVGMLALGVATLGVVYGDIGTSPIYAIRESLHASHGVAATQANVLGVLSLIFWSLILVISIKYLLLVMRADNGGEGGIIALTALAVPEPDTAKGGRWALALVGLFGAALLYGDGMITPAISVLSAIEGLEVATPFFRPYVIPITVGILVGLFAFQRRGTAGVGAVFGPVTLVWFLVLGILGLTQIVRHPGIAEALSPVHAFDFFGRNGPRGLLVLGSVFLVVTGGEALYADMGHFGRRPIRLTWFGLVLPALLLNYFGQGALILQDSSALAHPFFRMAPGWALLPLVGLSTAATVIASQAVISGAFSLTRQAVQLGYLPRQRIEHTSAYQAGQVYLPAINWLLMLACIGLVVGFRSSSRLAAAYGVAVTTDMVFTTLLLTVVARTRWGWSRSATGLMAGALLSIDLAFWGANLPKIPHGGWFPLLVAGGVFVLMTSWKRGRILLRRIMRSNMLPDEDFLRSIRGHPPQRVSGTAIYMDSDPKGIPHALLHNLKHNRVLHERVVMLTIRTSTAPYVTEKERAEVRTLGEGLYRIIARYGFAEEPDVPALLSVCHTEGRGFKRAETSFFLGRETIIPSQRAGMARWRKKLFARMSRNAQGATAFFRIPPNRVVELGAQVEI